MPVAMRQDDGSVVWMPDAEVNHAVARGMTPVNANDISADLTQTENRGGGVLGGVTAGLSSLASGATLGLTDAAARAVLSKGDADYIAEAREAHPYVSTAGTIAGALAPALLGDEAGLARLTPAGMTSRLGARIAERVGGTAGAIAAGAAEGAAQNAGAYVSDVALGDRDLSAEGFLGAMGKGALYGGVASGALSVASNGLIAARKLFPAAEATPEAVAAAKFEATQAIRNSVDTSSSIESTGTAAVAQSDRETQQFIQDLEAERTAAFKQAANAGRGLPSNSPELAGPEFAGTGREPIAAEPTAPPKSARELMQSWRAKYPEGAVDYNAATAAGRRQRLSSWAEGFQPANDEDAAIKAYFQTNKDPIGGDRIGGTADVPDSVQRVARQAAADASHQAYLDATAQGTNVAQSGTELMARATYQGRRAAARALDDAYGAYRAGASVSDIRAAAAQKLSGELHELSSARADMIHALASDPDAANSLMEQLTGTKAAIDQGVPLSQMSLGQRILAGVQKPLDPDEAIARAMGKTKDVNADIATIAPKITRYEAAKAQLTESLGDKASADAVAHAQAFRQAQQEAEAASTARTVQTTEDIDKATRGGVPADRAAGGQSIFKGLAKKASNMGAAYEMLRSLGIPLPDPHDVPVIGPLLSLYLKAKIISKVAGKFGGSFAATAEGTIAAKAAETQNRINGAVGRMLDTSADHLATAAPAAGRAVTPLAHKLFDDGTSAPYSSAPKAGKPEDDYRARLDELTAAMQPGAIDEAIRSRITTSDPRILNALIATETKRLQYLYNLAPKPLTPPLPGDPPWSPSRAEIGNFTTVLGAFHDPAAIFERVAAGGVARPAEVDCVKNCYPQLYAQAQKNAVDAMLQKRLPTSHASRGAISGLIGMPLDSSLTASFGAYVQQGNNTIMSTPGPAARVAQAAMSGSISLGDKTLTRLDKE